MKKWNGIAFILMIVMIVSGLFIGAHKGWKSERQEVDEAYQTLEEMLTTRIETANNILTVALRHVDEKDDFVQAVRKNKEVLSDKKADLSLKANANKCLTQNAHTLLQNLSLLDSVKEDSRDLMYVSQMLPQMLDDSLKYVVQNQYNQLAKEYNDRFNSSLLSGTLAKITGVQTAPVFMEK